MCELLTAIAVEHARHTSLLIEVCISDNASVDGTSDLVEGWAQQNASIPVEYFRHSENVGPDANYLAAAGLAKGEYIWLMGSDDRPRRGVFAAIETCICRKPDIILGSRMDHTIDMQEVGVQLWFNQLEDFDLNTRDRSDLMKYFESSARIGAQFSYLSSILVRRELWEKVEVDLSFVGSAYVHAQKLLTIIASGCSFLSVASPIVDNRLGNDFFSAHGRANRVLLDIRGYVRLSKIFPKELRKIFLLTLRKEHPPIRTSLYLRSELNANEWIDVRSELLAYGVNKILMAVLTRFPGVARAAYIGWVRRLLKRLKGWF